MVLGLASSGVHSNGFSLVRKVVERAGSRGMRRRRSTAPARSAKRLLTPTRIYVKSCLAAIRETKAVKALAHITGGGFPDNIPRVLPKGLGVALDLARVPVLPVFRWLAATGGVAEPKCCAPSIAGSAWWRWWRRAPTRSRRAGARRRDRRAARPSCRSQADAARVGYSGHLDLAW